MSFRQMFLGAGPCFPACDWGSQRQGPISSQKEKLLGEILSPSYPKKVKRELGC